MPLVLEMGGAWGLRKLASGWPATRPVSGTLWTLPGSGADSTSHVALLSTGPLKPVRGPLRESTGAQGETLRKFTCPEPRAPAAGCYMWNLLSNLRSSPCCPSRLRLSEAGGGGGWTACGHPARKEPPPSWTAPQCCHVQCPCLLLRPDVWWPGSLTQLLSHHQGCRDWAQREAVPPPHTPGRAVGDGGSRQEGSRDSRGS